MDSTIVVSLIGLVGTIAAALIGRQWGSLGKKKVFEKLPTAVNLNKTVWLGEYVDRLDNEGKPVRTGRIKFRQYGSRIMGEAWSEDEKRRWMLEGALSHRRLCYVYLDSDKSKLSIGTAVFELDDSGREFKGQWFGWSPEGERMQPQQVKLRRLA